MTHKVLNNFLWKKKHGTTISITFLFIFKFCLTRTVNMMIYEPDACELIGSFLKPYCITPDSVEE